MISLHDWLMFSGVALLMVCTPGPNMIYLVSRSICQGPRAGVISLFGVVTGFVVHMSAAAFGLIALFLAVPVAYDALRWAGALYLLWLAWQAVKPGARSPLQPIELPPDSPRRLYAMGFLTSLLNPKVAMLYLAILPQFVSAQRGSVLLQSFALGFTQIVVSFTVNLLIALSAAQIAAWFARQRGGLAAQRYLMGSVLAGLALRLAFEPRRPA